jgi:hypothetical protein
MAATAAVTSPDSIHPDADAIRRLGSPAESDRHAALTLLYTRWSARSLGMARGRVLRFYPKAWGRKLEELADEGMAQGWGRLVKRVLTSPLVLAEPVDQTFEAFLRRCMGSAIVDHLRRDRTGPGVVPALKQVQAALPDPAHRQWLQEMIDRQRAGLMWDHVTELSRSSGIAEDVLARFIDEQVRPALARTNLAAPHFAGDSIATRLERRDLLERLMERVDAIFGARTKGHLVASAMLQVLFTRPAVKGEATLDHEMLMHELEAMGEPWKSDGCTLSHAPGHPEAAQCRSCANALHQWRTRVTRRFREDPVFQEAAAILREESAFREVGGRTRQDDAAFRVSDDEAGDEAGHEGGDEDDGDGDDEPKELR